MSHKDISEVEPSGSSALAAGSQALFLETVRRSNAACQSGDFALAANLYTEALALDPMSHVLYSNRSAARLKMGMFTLALQDAVKATELNPDWPKAYYRQGVALQCLGRYGEALVAFSIGLAREPNNRQLLSGLVEASLKSPLRTTLEPTFQQLQAMKLDESPFVVISVVGQELLGAGQYRSAAGVLEAALNIGTCSLKLQGSVFSALSSAYWALNSLDKAIEYMQQDLNVARSLNDVQGECRAHGNLGSAYFSKGSYKEALTAHRYQLVLAMKCKDGQAAASALTSLGHVYTAVGDLPNALASHKQCVQLVKQMADSRLSRLQEAREIGNVGAVYLAMGEIDSALDCHGQHLRIARRLGDKVEEARAYSNLGSCHHYRRNFRQAMNCHQNVLRIAQELKDKAIETRAYAGLGHAARCAGELQEAKLWHQRQLDVALTTKDKVSEGRACSNLGIVYHLMGEHDSALKLHQAHLGIVRNLGDRAAMGRAYGNIGNAYNALGYHEQAIKYHKQELTISKEVNDRSSEASTHGNLAVAYQAIGQHEPALRHYRAHLSIARELKDAVGEACALVNLANCLSSRGRFEEAIPYYENYLMLSQELHDVEGEAKACHFLGYAHYCLGNHREAVRYYDQDLALAKDLQDKSGMGRAYCNLGLAHLALNNLDTALECQKYYLAIAHMTKSVAGKFRALGNIGECLLRLGETDEAIKMHQRQLNIARQSSDRNLEAAAYGALGAAHRTSRNFDKALGYHTQELTLRQEASDLKGECRAHGNLGAVHMSLGQYTHAVKCYQEQFDRAKELGDSGVEAQALGNLGIARLNMGHFEVAISYFEQQLGCLEESETNSSTCLLDKARALGNLGDCYEALGDSDRAIKCYEQQLVVSIELGSIKDQEQAYRGQGRAREASGNYQEALVCFEKRLLAAHEADSPESRAAAYGDLGRIHAALGNHEQAVSCLSHQMSLARSLGDRVAEAEAASGLGAVHLLMEDPEAAFEYHQLELEIGESLDSAGLQARACANLAATQEASNRLEDSVRLLEQALSLAAAANDLATRAAVFSSLGRLHHQRGDLEKALSYLQSGLSLAESLNRRDEMARLRHRLGLVYWETGELDSAAEQLEKAAVIIESLDGCYTFKPKEPNRSELLSQTYRILQRIHVKLGRPGEALTWAERSRIINTSHDFIQRNNYLNNKLESSSSMAHFLDIVDLHRGIILYFSEIEGELHSWCLSPGQGVARFHSSSLGGASLEERVLEARESLLAGESFGSCAPKPIADEKDKVDEDEDEGNEDDEAQGLPPPEEGGGPRPGSYRIASRGHHLNASSYSLSSLFSVGSVSSRVGSARWNCPNSSGQKGQQQQQQYQPQPQTIPRGGASASAPGSEWQPPSPIRSLYELLIAPFEDLLPLPRKELILVADESLYLAPLPALQPHSGMDYLCERFSLLVVPSLGALKRRSKPPATAPDQGNASVAALVAGNPLLPDKVRQEHDWTVSVPSAEIEANIVAELLETRPLLGGEATRSAVLHNLPDAECIHLSVPVLWDSGPSIALTADETRCPGTENDRQDQQEEQQQPAWRLDASTDLASVDTSARLVVVSSGHWSGQAHAAEPSVRGVGQLGRALLASGAECVLLGMWPVPPTAGSILLRAFYSAMLQGQRASRALAEAMQTVQHTRHFAHPANWAGWLLLGADTRLSNKVALMGQALAELLRSGPEQSRDALRVCLHLVEKSLQRIHCGQKNAMYTTQKSIENKVGSNVVGWRELLMSVGFRFEPAGNGIRPSVFFPQSDPEERLTRCSASLQALLGLGPSSLHALSSLLQAPEAAEDVITAMRRASNATEGQEINLPVRVWRAPGSHELFASLGFDLMEVGQHEVSLRTGKQASRRHVQFALQALLALFDTQEAPKSLSLVDSGSSSMESLISEAGKQKTGGVRRPLGIAERPRTLTAPRLGAVGAFASYVRSGRGEPDGKTMETPSRSLTRLNFTAIEQEEPSDNFTTTPPPTALKLKPKAPWIGRNFMYSEANIGGSMRPGSSSSGSVTSDWDNGGLGTILRRQQQQQQQQQQQNLVLPGGSRGSVGVLERLSVRSELGSTNTLGSAASSASKKSSSQSGCTTAGSVGISSAEAIEPSSTLHSGFSAFSGISNLSGLSGYGTAGSLTNAKSDASLPQQQEEAYSKAKGPQRSTTSRYRKVATTLTSLTRELTPSLSAEVYHERSLGLGLAPSLSELLEEVGAGTDDSLCKPSSTNLPGDTSNNKNVLHQIGRNSHQNIQTTGWLQNESELCSVVVTGSRRDEADGRSITDSQCSATSSNNASNNPIASNKQPPRRKAPPPPTLLSSPSRPHLHHHHNYHLNL